MDMRAFERIAAEEFAKVPPRFAKHIRNVALLVEEEPDEATRTEEGLAGGDTLLGLYRGIPVTERGEFYSGVLPDTITLYRSPLLEEADALLEEGKAPDREQALALAVRETLWHEIGHHFGMSEEEIHGREESGTNEFNRAPVVLRARPSKHMAKTLTFIFAAIFILAGCAAFVNNPLIGAGGLFTTDAALNTVYFVSGILLAAIGAYAPKRASLGLMILGVWYVLLALAGLVFFKSSYAIFGVNSFTNWLHLVLGAALIVAARYGKSISGDVVSYTNK